MSKKKQKEIKAVEVVTSDQYKNFVEEEIKKVIKALRSLSDGQNIKEFKIVKNKKSPFTDLFKTMNHHSRIFQEKIPKLNRCNLDLASSVKELNRFKKDLEREEILEHTIIKYMAEAMFVTDLNGNIIIINEIAKKILGYNIDLVGKNVFKFDGLCGKDGKKISAEEHPLNKVIKSQKMIRVSFSDGWTCRRKNGTIFPIRIYVYPVKTARDVKAIVVIFHDATKERRIDEIKSDFISVASHQLRTPLAVSTLHTEMLLAGHAGELNPEQREYVNEIYFYNKKMADLLGVFLSVSKIEMDTFTTDIEPVFVEEILDDTLRELAVNITKRRVQVSKIYFKHLPKVLVDKSLLRVAFQNIIANAIKYNVVKGKVTIETKLIGNQVLVEIRDTGLGIAEADKSRVFLKLYRGNNAKRNDSEGTGLGLYIAKYFIEKIGGKIWFESQEGVGTTFFVSLPISEKIKNNFVSRSKNKAMTVNTLHSNKRQKE